MMKKEELKNHLNNLVTFIRELEQHQDEQLDSEFISSVSCQNINNALHSLYVCVDGLSESGLIA